jgi:hypothetical protein
LEEESDSHRDRTTVGLFFFLSYYFIEFDPLLESIDFLLSPMVYTNITGVSSLSLSRDLSSASKLFLPIYLSFTGLDPFSLLVTISR